jgi:hypothetical protein
MNEQGHRKSTGGKCPPWKKGAPAKDFCEDLHWWILEGASGKKPSEQVPHVILYGIKPNHPVIAKMAMGYHSDYWTMEKDEAYGTRPVETTGRTTVPEHVEQIETKTPMERLALFLFKHIGYEPELEKALASDSLQRFSRKPTETYNEALERFKTLYADCVRNDDILL